MDAAHTPPDRYQLAEEALTEALEQEEPEAQASGQTRARRLLQWMLGSRELATLAVCILLFALFTAGNPRYASVNIILDIARRLTPIALLAIGMTFLMVSGELDISIGANFGFCSILLGQLASEQHHDPWLSMVIVVLVGLAIGTINGLAVTLVGLPSFIATLGMLAALRGLGNALTGGVGTYAKDTEQSFYTFMSGTLPGTRIPNSFTIMLVCLLIGALVLGKTKFGSDVYATGGNVEAARNNGIDTRRTKLICFMLTGLLGGLTGAMQFGWVQYSPGNSGIGFELQVIAAAIIGGVGLFGGRGTVIGSFLGGVILSMLTSGLIMIGVKDYWDGVLSGLVIVATVGLDLLVRRGAARALEQAA